MSGVDEFQCTLLGTVEVTRTMSPLDADERFRMAKICHTAIVKKAMAVRDRSWLLRPQHFSEKVTLEIDHSDEEIALYNGDYLMSQHPIATISIMVTLEGNTGHVVYIGHCSKDDRRLAVVLSFNYFREANSMIKKYEKIKRKTSPRENNVLSNTLEGKEKNSNSIRDSIQIVKEKYANDKDKSQITKNDEENYLNDNEENYNKNEYKSDKYINDDTEENLNVYENPTIEKNVAPELPSRSNSNNNLPKHPPKIKDSPPPIPTTPKPSQNTSTQLTHKNKIDEEKKYVDDDEETDTKNKCTDDEYINDSYEEKFYENPESQRKVQTKVPARNKSETKVSARNKSDEKKKTESPNKEQKGGLLGKFNFGGKKNKSATTTEVKESPKVKKKTNTEVIQNSSGKRPLPSLPGEKTNNAHDEADDNDSIYEEIDPYRIYNK